MGQLQPTGHVTAAAGAPAVVLLIPMAAGAAISVQLQHPGS